MMMINCAPRAPTFNVGIEHTIFSELVNIESGGTGGGPGSVWGVQGGSRDDPRGSKGWSRGGSREGPGSPGKVKGDKGSLVRARLAPTLLGQLS